MEVHCICFLNLREKETPFCFKKATRGNNYKWEKSLLCPNTELIAGLQVTSRGPCWRSKTKAFLSAGK